MLPSSAHHVLPELQHYSEGAKTTSSHRVSLRPLSPTNSCATIAHVVGPKAIQFHLPQRYSLLRAFKTCEPPVRSVPKVPRVRSTSQVVVARNGTVVGETGPMDNLRRRRLGGRTALQTPVVSLAHAGDRRRAVIVLTAHLGDQSYYDNLRAVIERELGTVYFESVRSLDDREEHWREPYHSFLKNLREQLYAGIASVGPFAFQGDHLLPQRGWVNADVDCCALAAKLREARVALAPYNISLALLQRLIERAKRGDIGARMSLERAIKWGLLAISLPFVFEFANRLPRTRALYAVINDWRSAEAVASVLRTEDDFVLVYGAAHGDALLRGLAERGFREVRREWLTVLLV